MNPDEGGGHGKDHRETDETEADSSKNEGGEHAGTADNRGGGSSFPRSDLYLDGERMRYGGHKIMFFLRLEILL